MNNILDIEIILKKQKYSFVYNVGTILVVILLIVMYISCMYNYKTYYLNKAVYKDNNLEVLVMLDDIKYIANNNILVIDNISYSYDVVKISEDLYVDDSYNNYKYVYLNVDNLSSINNYVYELKLEKQNKKIIEYIKDYL